MNNHLPITIRPATKSDINFIINSWLESKKNSYDTLYMSDTVLYGFYKPKIVRAIERSRYVVVACSEDAPEQIIGWCVADVVADVFVLHYIYTKYVFRHLGIAKALLQAVKQDDLEIVCTSLGKLTKSNEPIFRKLQNKYNLIYNPYLL